MQGIYENVRCEALEHSEPASWALERVRRYGVASLLPGGHPDFPFILCAQSVPRPAWSGTKDFYREKLREIYEFLTTIRAIYLPWLEKLATLAQAGSSSYPTSGPQSCRVFPVEDGTVYVFADGMRVDVAKCLEEKLVASGATIEFALRLVRTSDRHRYCEAGVDATGGKARRPPGRRWFRVQRKRWWKIAYPRPLQAAAGRDRHCFDGACQE